MRHAMSVIMGLFLAGSVAYAAPKTKPTVKCPKGYVTADAYSDCMYLCDRQYETCLNGCRHLPEDSEEAASCVRGCMRGYQGCKGRCGPPFGSFNKEQRSDGTVVVADCTQLPKPCSSNSDCECSGCCGQLGEGGPKVCQPSC